MDRPFLSLVVPAYNEQSRLPSTPGEDAGVPRGTKLQLRGAGGGRRQRGHTPALVEKAMARFPQLRLLREPHRGKGHAVRQGMLAARGDYVMFCDADLSMPVEEVPKFPAALQGPHGVAIGSREVKGARRIGEPGHRHLMGRVFNLIVRLLAVPGLQDTQCGFKCFTRDAVQEIFRRQTIDGFGFDVEVLYIAGSWASGSLRSRLAGIILPAVG